MDEQPKTWKPQHWWYVLAVISLLALAWMGRYELISSNSSFGLVYKLNRITGTVEVIGGLESLGVVKTESERKTEKEKEEKITAEQPLDLGKEEKAKK